MAILDCFYLYEFFPKYASCILACTENMLKAYKLSRRIRQECFADRHKIEQISATFTKTPKNSDPKSPLHTWSNEQKTISCYCLFNCSLQKEVKQQLLITQKASYSPLGK